MVARNEEALASPIYKPDLDEKTVEIFSLMKTYPPELVAQYRQVFESMPTTNPFVGVLSNPMGCEISQTTTDLGQIIGRLEERYEEIKLAGTPPAPTTDENGNTSPSYVDPAAAALLQEWDTYMPQIRSDLNNADGALGSYQNHTDRVVANLPSLVGIAQNALGITAVMLDLLDPCLGLSEFFGSIMEAGRRIIDAIMRAINEVMAVIEEVISAIMAAINAVMAAIQELLMMIANEIQKLVEALIDSVRMGLAALLKLLPNDPCLRALLGAVSTGALIAVLNK